MVKRFILGGLLIVAAACGDDDDAADPSKGDAAVSGASGSGGSSTSSAGSSGSNSSSSGGSGTGGTSSGTSGSPASGDSGAGGSGDPGTAPTDGSQLARCEDDDDCADGLNCYEFGGYCSAACATDADCASLGTGYTCNARAGGGGMQGGGFPGGGMQGDAAAPEPNGTCRAQCTGATDTSCPAGLTCRSAGGGFMGGGRPGGGQMGGDAGMATGGTFRCGYEPEEDMPDPPPDGGMGTDMPGTGTTGAFAECEDDDECADGLECTGGGRGGNGYCAQSCEEATDCAMQPGSGSAELTCGFGGTCSLSCAEDGQMCPDGMTCVRGGGGGGGGGSAFCGFAAQGGGNNGGGNNGPGGGGP